MALQNITEEELLAITLSKDKIKELEKEIKALKREIEIKEASVLERLKAGAEVAAGWVASSVIKLGNIVPKWRAEWKMLATRFDLDIEEEEAEVRSRYSPSEKEILIITKEK